MLSNVRAGAFAQIIHALNKFSSQFNGVVFKRDFTEWVVHLWFASRCPPQRLKVENQLFLSVSREKIWPLYKLLRERSKSTPIIASCWVNFNVYLRTKIRWYQTYFEELGSFRRISKERGMSEMQVITFLYFSKSGMKRTCAKNKGSTSCRNPGSSSKMNSQTGR